MAPIELIAACFGLACVVLTVRQHMACWPAGLVQVVLYIWIFFDAKLYSDMLLHVIYVGMSVYGWCYWARGGSRDQGLPVTTLSLHKWVMWLITATAGTSLLGWSMHRWTDAAVPYWDAATTVLSLIAQYLMARKKLESWLFWITVDVLAIGIYFAKELYITTGLYAVFLVLAVLGFMTWQRSITRNIGVPVEA